MIAVDAYAGRCVWTALLIILCVNAHADEKKIPCAKDSIFQQQDFALGSWEVYEADKKVAEATLTKALKGCAMTETWTSLSDDEENGLGLFMYSRLLKNWGYFWTADNGATTRLTGALQSPGTMLYVTDAPLPGGGTRQRHWNLALQPDGSIRELATGTNDGKTWTTDYELFWRRKK